MNRKWKIAVGIMTGLTALAVIVWLSPAGRFLITEGFSLEEQPFDRQQWKTAMLQEPSGMRTRLLMLEDLLENHLKTGMDSTAVKDLLGEPERKHGFSYDLGMLTAGMEPLYLIPEFDAAGKVKKFNIHSEGKLKSPAKN